MNRFRPPTCRAPLAIVLPLVLAAGCGEQITRPVLEPPGGPSFWPDGSPPARTSVCKEGPDGTYSFEIVYEGVGTLLVGESFTLQAGECKEVYEGGSRVEGFRVTEVDLPEGFGVESITVVDLEQGPACPDYCGTFTGTDSRNAQVWKDRGFVFTFRNFGPDPGPPSLRIDKVADAASVEAGDPIGFAIEVRNDGPGTATGVTLSDPLPVGTGIAWSIDPANPDCSLAAGTLTCAFGDLAAGESRSVHVSSPTAAQSCGTYPNTATAQAVNHGPVSAGASTTVECPPPPTCGRCEGKVTALTLLYTGPAGQVQVVQKKDKKVIFSGPVATGATFSFVGQDKKGTMGTDILLFVDGVLNTQIHTSCSQPIGPGLVSGSFEVVAGESLKGGALCPIDLPPTGECDFCETIGGKPQVLTMEYTGDDCLASSHTQDPSKVSCAGDPAQADPVRIRATDRSSPTDGGGRVYFDGTVPLGGSFQIDARNAGASELRADTWVHIYAADGTVLQSVRFHTSCSQPLNDGDQFGALRLTGFQRKP